MLDAIIEAKQIARQRGGNLIFVASVCGTESDPQDKKLQTKLLQEAGVLVFPSNALATMACEKILEQVKG